MAAARRASWAKRDAKTDVASDTYILEPIHIAY
jgi:hypothetical protein